MSARDSAQSAGQSRDKPTGRRGDPQALVVAASKGDRVALGRLLSLVEEAGPAADEVDRLVTTAWPKVVVGMTGAPGVGKSTLTDCLVSLLRNRERRVAVLAIDPTSPVTGGAILGDRVRMTGHAADPAVFIRSVATRGASGGLTATVPGVLRVIAAAGFDTVILETVGVGQIELDVAGVAETVVVVVTPGAGDEVQAVKAGVLEIASIFVVNKADLDGAAQTEADLLAAMSLATPGPDSDAQQAWKTPVLRTVARSGDGVDSLVDQIDAHAAWLQSSGNRSRHTRERQRLELANRVQLAYRNAATKRIESPDFVDAVDRLAGGLCTVSDALQAVTANSPPGKLT